MHNYQKKFLDQTLALGLPVNENGYAEDELMLMEQFIAEYAASGLDIIKEIDAGRLPVLIRNNKILIARSDANRWEDNYWTPLVEHRYGDNTDAAKRHPRNNRR